MKTKDLKIKPFSRNKIQKRIYQLAAERNISAEVLEDQIQEALDISAKQLTYFLDNLGNPPSIKEFCIISQILDCTVDDLIELKA